MEIHWNSSEEQATTCNLNLAMLVSVWVAGPVLLLCLVAFPAVFPDRGYLMEKPPLPMALMFVAYWLHAYLLFKYKQRRDGLDVHGKPLVAARQEEIA